MNHIIRFILFSCFLLKTTTHISANIAANQHFRNDTIGQKKIPQLATDPTYKPLNKSIKEITDWGLGVLFTGAVLALLTEKLGGDMPVIQQFLGFGVAFICLFGGLLTIIWGLIILLKRWITSVNRRRIADNRRKIKWWAWISLALGLVWFTAMVLILGL
jgi:hypothetical protein